MNVVSSGDVLAAYVDCEHRGSAQAVENELEQDTYAFQMLAYVMLQVVKY